MGHLTMRQENIVEKNNIGLDSKLIQWDELMIGTNSERVANPFSGISVELPPQAVAVYDLAMGAEQLGLWKILQNSKDWFRKYFPAEYMILLD